DAALASEASGDQSHLAHIRIGVAEGSPPDQISQAQARAEQLKAQLEAGAIEFQAAAVRYSDSPNALEGGDLGWRSVDEIPAAFATAIRGLQAGQVIGPIRGPSGFQLLQLVETRSGDQAAGQGVTQYRARHILVRTEGEDDAAAKARIDTLRARIAGGADFAEVDKES